MSSMVIYTGEGPLPMGPCQDCGKPCLFGGVCWTCSDPCKPKEKNKSAHGNKKKAATKPKIKKAVRK